MRLRLAIGAACLGLATWVAAQQSYPNRPIRIVVGYSAGGGNDIVVRVVAPRMSEGLGQPVIVENRPGAQSIIACEYVAKAAPDGHTLLMGPSGPMTMNPALYPKLPYSPLEDFAPISMIGDFPLILVVSASLPVRTVKELIAHAKARPDQANYAASAAPFQLASELFNQKAGTKFAFIPYKGSGDSVAAVVSGQVTMTIMDPPPAIGPLKSGKVRGLAFRDPPFHRFPCAGRNASGDRESAAARGGARGQAPRNQEAPRPDGDRPFREHARGVSRDHRAGHQEVDGGGEGREHQGRLAAIAEPLAPARACSRLVKRLAEHFFKRKALAAPREVSLARLDLFHQPPVAQDVQRFLEALIFVVVQQNGGGLAVARDDDLLLAFGDAGHQFRQARFDFRNGQGLGHRDSNDAALFSARWPCAGAPWRAAPRVACSPDARLRRAPRVSPRRSRGFPPAAPGRSRFRP